MLVSMRVTAPDTNPSTVGSVGDTAAAAARPRGLWARLAAAAVADEIEPDLEPEPAHVDFLRRMADIDEAYDQGLVATTEANDADVVDFTAARDRLRPSADRRALR
jgi:hypothetical protein